MAEELRTDRDQVIKYFKTNPNPVVDTTINDIGKVLSTNTYQKAGWVLHMLRHEIGDDAFWQGIQKFYARYRNSNALTGDFRQVMEEVSGNDLKPFFQQWLFRGGHPKLRVVWNYDGTAKILNLAIHQSQDVPFIFPLDIGLRTGNSLERKSVMMTAQDQSFSFQSATKPSEIILDPFTWLLFDGSITSK